ncbi:MAG: Uxx-star family glutaredoxin-like (seleno)protein [Desulfotomaculales bacterium]
MEEIVIYTKTGCPYCRKTMDEYRARGIPFREVNVSENPEAKDLIKRRFRADRVPVIVKDGELVQIGDASGMG